MIDIRLCLADSPPPGDIPIKIRCRATDFMPDDTPSMCVYPNHIHCFHCGYHNSSPQGCVRFLLGAGHDVNKYESSRTDLHRDRMTQAAELDPLPKQLADVYNMFLSTGSRVRRLPWLLDRGLTRQTISKYNLGHDGTRFTIPIYNKKGQLISIRYRRDDAYGTLDRHECEIPKYCGTRGRNGLCLYPAFELGQDVRDYVVVCEGELDALRLRQENINAVSPTNGIGSFKHVPELLRNFPKIKKVYIAADKDDAGAAGAGELLQALDTMQYEVKVLEWPVIFKDITELYRAGQTIESELN